MADIATERLSGDSIEEAGMRLIPTYQYADEEQGFAEKIENRDKNVIFNTHRALWFKRLGGKLKEEDAQHIGGQDRKPWDAPGKGGAQTALTSRVVGAHDIRYSGDKREFALVKLRDRGIDADGYVMI